jgi:hypothetical protein
METPLHSGPLSPVAEQGRADAAGVAHDGHHSQ